MSALLSLQLGRKAEIVVVRNLVIAGWTGRDRDAVEHHIAELEKIGVKRPASVPIFYRVSAARLTTEPSIQAIGEESSGEIEFVLLQSAGRTWVGVGSDHTDREAETVGVTLSKQMCDKPIGQNFWPFEEVAPHFDQLILRAHIVEGGKKVLYQEGAVTAMHRPADLIDLYTDRPVLDDDTLMFCGTLAAKGGVRPSEAEFFLQLEDPVLKRSLTHSYRVQTLPVAG